MLNFFINIGMHYLFFTLHACHSELKRVYLLDTEVSLRIYCSGEYSDKLDTKNPIRTVGLYSCTILMLYWLWAVFCQVLGLCM